MYILCLLARTEDDWKQLYLRVDMTCTTSTLYVLNKCIVEIESVSGFSAYLQGKAQSVYRTIKLQSGISRPSSAIEVAN